MRLYGLEEARAVLPQVQPVLQAIHDAVVELRAMQAALNADIRGVTGDGALLANPWAEHDQGADRAETLTEALKESVAQLERWGIELKDPEKGLIDFYWEREGRVVYLCYMLGEPDIEWWHPLETGFAGRERI